jgi:hypothetical protein
MVYRTQYGLNAAVFLRAMDSADAVGHEMPPPVTRSSASRSGTTSLENSRTVAQMSHAGKIYHVLLDTLNYSQLAGLRQAKLAPRERF